MANERRIDYEILFRANQLSLQNVSKTFQNMLKSIDSYSKLLIINNSTKAQAIKDLNEITKLANIVEESLTAAFNPKLGITNIETFKLNLKSAGTSIENVRLTFDRAGGAGVEAFLSMANSLTNVRLKATESLSILDKLGDSFKRVLTYNISSSILNKLTGSIQEAYGYVKHLDTSLNDIRIVTEYSAEAMDRFAEKANKAAISLGKSTTDYTEAALIYYQQGLGEEDVEARTNVTLKTANVTQQSTAQVSEQLTAIWNGYKVNAEEAEAYIDKVAKVAAKTAADLEEMATGMSKVASAANVMGVDIDQMNAILATTISVTRQAPESVGAAYKTIFARMSTIQAGEETEDGATLTSYTEKMAALGVSALDTNGKLRDMGDIIEEVGAKWQNWSREQQIAFAQVAAGTRLYNNLIALFDNWDMYTKTLEESRNAMGTLQTLQDIYMESTAAHLQQLRTAAEGVYDSLLDTSDINSVVDVFTEWTKGIETVVDGLGGLKGILAVIAPLILRAFSTNIGQILGLTFSNFTIKQENILKLLQLDAAIKALEKDAPNTSRNYLKLKESLGSVAGNIKPELFNRLSESFEKLANVTAKLESNNTNLITTELKLKDLTQLTIITDEKKKLLQEALKNAILERIKALNKLNIEEEKSKNRFLGLGVNYGKEVANLYQSTSGSRADKADRVILALKNPNSGFTITQTKEADLRKGLERSTDIYRDINKLLGEANGNYKLLIEAQEKLNSAINKENIARENDLKFTTEEEHLRLQEELEKERNRIIEERKALEAENARLKAGYIELEKEAVRQFGESVTQIASGILSLMTMVSQVENLMKTLNDETLTEGERTKLVLSQAASLALSFTMTSSSLIKGIQTAYGALLTFAVASIASSKGLDAATVSADMFTAAEIRSTIATIAFRAALIGLIAGGIIALIVLLIKHIKSFTTATEDATKALEELKKVLLETKQSYDEAKESLDKFNDSFSALEELKSALEEMTEGTKGWKELLEKILSTTEKLLLDYPELMKYAHYENGGWTLDEEGAREYLRKLQQDVNMKQVSVLNSTYGVNLGNYNVKVGEALDYLQSLHYQSGFLTLLNSKDVFSKEDASNKLVQDMQLTEKELSILAEQWANVDSNMSAYYNKLIELKKEETDLEELQLEIQKAIIDNYLRVDLDYAGEKYKETHKGELSDDEIELNKAIAQGELAKKASNNAKDIADAIAAARDEKDYEGIYPYLEKMLGDEFKNRKQEGLNFTATSPTTFKWEDKEGKTHNLDIGSWELLEKEFNLNSIDTDEINRVFEEVASRLEKTGADWINALDSGKWAIDRLNKAAIEAIEQEDPNSKYITEWRTQRAEEEARLKYSKSGKGLLGELTDEGGQFSNITNEQYKLLVNKIEEVIASGTIDEFTKFIKGKEFEVAITFNLDEITSDLLQKLDDAKIDFSVFEAEKRARANENLTDDLIINYLKAQKDLNDIYLKRQEFFEVFEEYDSNNATRELTDNLVKLKTALDKLTGKDLSFDFIEENLKNILGYIDGDIEKTNEFKKALVELAISEQTDKNKEGLSKIENIFKDINIQYGESLPANIKENIEKIANELGWSEDVINKLFLEAGYVWDSNAETWTYNVLAANLVDFETRFDSYKAYLESAETLNIIPLSEEEWAKKNGYKNVGTLAFPSYEKTTELRDYFSYLSEIIEDSSYLKNSGDTISVSGLDRYGGIKGEDLEKYGWEFVTSEGGLPFWKKTASGLDVFTIKYLIDNNLDIPGINEKETEATKKLKDYARSTTTHDQIELPSPKLDTSDLDRQAKQLSNKISDLKKELAETVPGTQSYADAVSAVNAAEEENIALTLKKIDVAKEFIAVNKEATVAAIEAKTGIKVLFDEMGNITNLSDFTNFKADSSAYDAAAAKFTAANERFNKLLSLSVNQETGEKYTEDELKNKLATYSSASGTGYDAYLKDIKAADSAKNTYDKLATEYKLSYDSANKSIKNLVETLGNLSSANDTVIEGDRELKKLQDEMWQELLDRKTKEADMLGEEKAKYEELTHSIDDTKKSLSKLGDEKDYSSAGLGTYYEKYQQYLDDTNKSLKEQNDLLEANNQKKKAAVESIMTEAVGDKLSLKDLGIEAREDGSYNAADVENKIRDKVDALKKEGKEKQAEDLEASIEHILNLINGINSNVTTIETNTDSISDNIAESARAAASLTFVLVNKDLDDLNRKLDIAKEKLDDAKTLFDKSSSSGSIEALEEWKKEYEEYLQYLDKVGDKYKEKMEKIFSMDSVKKLTTDEQGESIFNLFNAKTREEFLDGYYEYLEAIEEVKERLEKEMDGLRGSKDEGDIERLKELEAAYKELGDAEAWAVLKKKEYINQKLDVSEVEKLSKEWKTASIDREIKKVSRELSLLQKLQSRLKGKDIITNLQQQIEVIKKQIALEQKKMNIMKSLLNVQKSLIMMQISAMKLSNLGSAFDSSGHVSGAFLDKLAKSANITNEELQMLINSLKEYESIMSLIESQEDAILSLQDEIADKSYEIAEKEYENFRELMEKELNKFKIEIEVALNEADLMRQIDRLRAKVAGITDRDLAKQMSLDISDAVSYATKDITILTDAVNKLLGDYSSGAWKDFYDTLKDAYDDILSYASKLISAVQAFYDALDSAREKYSLAIDEVINANQLIIADYEHIKKIAKHGINITKMLFGENSYELLSAYYDKIEAATREQIAESKRMAEYYKALLSTIDPMTHPDEYKAVKEAYKSAMDDVYNYGEQLMDSALERFNAKLDAAGRKFLDTMAKSSGYDNTTMMDLAHDQLQYILKGFLDEYESLYEIVTLLNKFTDAINLTSDAAQKSKLTKVMQELVKYLNDLVAKEGRLTKYQVDRANLMYELTLKLMALEEARDNKTKMRLRRDSQGNYRYEYIADEENTLKATQDVLDTQYLLYELDKQRLLDLQQLKLRLWQEYEEELKKILENENLTEEQKKKAAEELHTYYVGRLEDIYRQHGEVVKNIEESSGGVVDEVLQQVIEETSSTAGETAGTLDIVKKGVTDLYQEGLESLDSYSSSVKDALDLITGGTGDLEGAINSDIEATLELIDTDETLLDAWMDLLDICAELLAELEALEDEYRALAEAALDAAEAAAELKVTDFSTADLRNYEQTKEATKSTSSSTPKSGDNGGSKPKEKEKEPEKHGTKMGYLDGWVVIKNGKTIGYYVDSNDLKAVNAVKKSMGGSFFDSYAAMEAAIDDYNKNAKPNEKTVKHPNRFKYSYSFDTGGYTGEWDSSGKLAVLHLKELVLNARDTENFLKAVDVMRTLLTNIDNIQSYARSIGNPNVNVTAPSADLNQNVHIDASFPNVSNSKEIEDAFNNLVNLASQRAMSTRR